MAEKKKTSEAQAFKNDISDRFSTYQTKHKSEELPDAILHFCEGIDVAVHGFDIKTLDPKMRPIFDDWTKEQLPSLTEYYRLKGNAAPEEQAIGLKNQLMSMFPNRHIKSWEAFRQSILSFDPSNDFNSELFGRRFPIGTISYIGARPGRGKTTMLVNLAMDAIAKGKRVSFITAEETTKQLIVRFILREMYSIARKECLPQDLADLEGDKDYKPRSEYFMFVKNQPAAKPYTGNLFHKAEARIAQLITDHTLEIFEAYGASWAELVQYLGSLASGRVVLIDYVQHLKMPENVTTQTRQIQVQEASHILADTAGVCGFIAIAGAQFNRPGRGTTESEDVFDETSFRESGDIEQDGHILIGIGKNPSKNQFFYSCIKDREAEPDNGKKWKLEARMQFSFFDAAFNENGKRGSYRSSSSMVQESTEQEIYKRVVLPNGRGFNVVGKRE